MQRDASAYTGRGRRRLQHRGRLPKGHPAAGVIAVGGFNGTDRPTLGAVPAAVATAGAMVRRREQGRTCCDPRSGGSDSSGSPSGSGHVHPGHRGRTVLYETLHGCDPVRGPNPTGRRRTARRTARTRPRHAPEIVRSMSGSGPAAPLILPRRTTVLDVRGPSTQREDRLERAGGGCTATSPSSSLPVPVTIATRQHRATPGDRRPAAAQLTNVAVRRIATRVAAGRCARPGRPRTAGARLLRRGLFDDLPRWPRWSRGHIRATRTWPSAPGSDRPRGGPGAKREFISSYYTCCCGCTLATRVPTPQCVFKARADVARGFCAGEETAGSSTRLLVLADGSGADPRGAGDWVDDPNSSADIVPQRWPT